MESMAMKYDITLIPGDGVGPEVTAAAVRAVEATGIEIRWDTVQMGQATQDTLGTPLPESALASVRRNRVALKGPVTTPVGSGFRSANVALRKALDLYACVRPCRTYPGIPSPFPGVDLVVVRENTEDLYSGIEFQEGTPDAAEAIGLIKRTLGESVGQDSGLSIKAISETASRRIVRFAFEYARAHHRRKVTAVHKANILKFSDGLFLSVAREEAGHYPDIEFEDRLADNMNMQLVRNPRQFDVVVAPNLYGDLLSDLCAGLIGGLGVAPGANFGDGIAVFEAVHGSAPRHAGRDKVNPMAMMFSAVLMLRHLREPEKADLMETAVAEVIAEGRKVTYDIKRDESGPAAGTSEVAEAVVERIRRRWARYT
jgi:isocitrate dehydrogenase (NAD+)